MKTKKTVAIVCLLLLTAALVCLAFVGCDKNPGEEKIKLTGEYNLIRSEVASDSVKKAFGSVAEALKTMGIEMTVGTDWIDRKGVADFPEQPLEVLIGETNRQESIDALATLGLSEFTVRVVGNKIVAVGKDDFCTVRAAEYLIEHYFSAEADGEIPNDLCYTGQCDYMYCYKITPGANEMYDAVATVATMQGLYNRESGHLLYLTASNTKTPDELLDIMSDDDHWMEDINRLEVKKFTDLLALVKPYVQCVAIWDTDVPATLNVATTVAGAENGIIMTKKQYDTYKSEYFDGVKTVDLCGRFDGSVSGSAKNDAYLWAIDEYLAKGRCSLDYIFSCEDSYGVRESGNIRYCVVRDWAVYNKAFVFDLSMWEDEAPKDDPKQKNGLDKSTLMTVFRKTDELRGKNALTEIDGFLSATKYSDSGNDELYTSKYKSTNCEWEFAYLFSPYGFYWNPVIEWSYNLSVHQNGQFTEPLKQNRPAKEIKLDDSDDEVYVLVVMGDYDSTGSIYTKLYPNWKDNGRGKIPLAWSVNPNNIKEYPDLISYFYETATPNDYFVSNAGAAGWFTPSRVPTERWPLYIELNKHFFGMTDMSCAPDFWDYQAFSPEIEGYVGQFATTGMGTLVSNQLKRGTGTPLNQHLSADGIPVDPLYNYYVRDDAAACGKKLAEGVAERTRAGHATFLAFRAVWSTPTYLNDCIDALQEEMPNKFINVVDPYTYYRLFAESFGE